MEFLMQVIYSLPGVLLAYWLGYRLGKADENKRIMKILGVPKGARITGIHFSQGAEQ